MVQILEFQQVSSTMDTALEYVQTQFPHIKNTIILARTQTAGRGQYGRQWISQEGNLLATMIWLQELQQNITPSLLSIISGLAGRKALEGYTKNKGEILLKWPNDLLLDAKKVGGVLIQREAIADRIVWLIGIGMNLRYHPEIVEYPATNLESHIGICIDAKVLIRTVFNDLLYYIDIFERKGFQEIRNIWTQHAFGLQQMVCVQWKENEETLCVFEGIGDDGFPVFTMDQKIIRGQLPLKILWKNYNR